MKCFEHNAPYTLICQVKDCGQKLMCNQCMTKHNAQHYPMIQGFSDMDYQIKQVPQLLEKDLDVLKARLYSIQNHMTVEKEQLKKQVIKLSEVLKSRINAEVDDFCSSALEYTNSYYKQYETEIGSLLGVISEHMYMVAPYTTRVRPINENQFGILMDFQEKMNGNVLPSLQKRAEVISKQVLENQLYMRTDHFYNIVKSSLGKALQSYNLFKNNELSLEQKRATHLQTEYEPETARSALFPSIDFKRNALELLRDNQQPERKSVRIYRAEEGFTIPKNRSSAEFSGSRYIYAKAMNTVLSGHTDIVTCLCIFSQSSLISAGGGGIIKIWDIDGGVALGQMSEHAGDVWALAKINETNFGSASADQTVRIWNYQRMICESVLVGHLQPVKSLIYLKDLEYLASGSLDSTIKIWTTNRAKLKLTIQNNQRVRALCYVQTKGLIVSGGENTIGVYNVLNGSCKDQLDGHHGEVLCLKYLQESLMGEFMSVVASGGADKKIILWNLDRAIKLHIFVGHQEAVTCLTFDIENRQLWSGSADRTIRCWDIATGKSILTAKRHSEQISALEYMPGRELIISGSWDHRIRVTQKQILMN
ncbi:unnamed protein product (macronuclear) [Paramecium tetraurelia]|uniref:Uncharacterized protein n=1 Tax=Paramecium tetraurelia TaxID=5888 RepID=A0BFY6_PARTE|nr:uncharacterized protein GSPATT00028488001 [Paramecium tetraurelia]CAK57453.1 unnamed protein product [Paramecium tetraurelia]|eukprot:XP_001424851.1 hypothetical protein (macronuclear) [Paramecium tetraurelia strain d4-2]